jgi:hypothetical protein
MLGFLDCPRERRIREHCVSGRGAHEEDQHAPITESDRNGSLGSDTHGSLGSDPHGSLVVAARGSGCDDGARLRGLRRHHDIGLTERRGTGLGSAFG